jgi:uncharacterized protein (TIGR00290 family)
MTSAIKTLLAWSSGKDSAYALWSLRRQADTEVVGLLTTLNAAVERVSMHGVRESVLEAQAAACGLPLWKVWLPDPCSDEQYRAAMSEATERARGQGIRAIAFGDLFLADVRAYREAQLAGSGVTPLFPLWGQPTAALAKEMIDEGMEALITCVDTERLNGCFAGRCFDQQLLEELPPGVDPCAENGEFHTVAVAGPMFRKRIAVEVGSVVERDRFVFVDVLLRKEGQTEKSNAKKGEQSASVRLR